MTCTHCGSPAAAPTGYCGTCGRAVTPPAPAAAWSAPPGIATDVTMAFPAVRDPIMPYGAPAATYAMPAPYDTYNGGVPPVQPYGNAADPYATAAYSRPSGWVPVQPHSPSPDRYGPAPDLYNGPPDPAYAPLRPTYAPGQFPAQQGTPQFGNPPPYGQPPYHVEPNSAYGPPRSAGNVLSIVALVLAAVALLLVPVLGVASIICAGVAVKRRERLGIVALILGIAGTVGGFLLDFLAWF